MSCDGAGREKISVADRIKAAGLAVARRWPEKKAIDLDVTSGGATLSDIIAERRKRRNELRAGFNAISLEAGRSKVKQE